MTKEIADELIAAAGILKGLEKDAQGILGDEPPRWRTDKEQIAVAFAALKTCWAMSIVQRNVIVSLLREAGRWPG